MARPNRQDMYPPAYDKTQNNKLVGNVPDSWITRWPERYTRELGTQSDKKTTAKSPATETKE